jgi:aldose sugar dehydrogenase
MTGRRFALALMTSVALAIWLVLPGGASTAFRQEGEEPLPPGVQVEVLLRGMQSPVAMAFDPEGRLFYTEKSGAVRLFADGVLQPDPVITFAVETGGERGLIGIALDPNFSSNRHIYVYYTCTTTSGDCPNPENRVVRIVERDGKGSDPVTVFTTPQTSEIHTGGNLHFGPDGMLYVSVGDNGEPANGQLYSSTSGKIHRLNPDGSSPSDNPLFAQEGAIPSLYATGLRNSFDFTFDPVVMGRIFASENGPGCDDEMNRIEAGFNYGWRSDYPCDDFAPDPQHNSIAPLWYVPEGACCLAPTGIEVYTGNQIPQWRNHLFMATFNTGALYHFELDAAREKVQSARIVQGVKANMDVETGPDGAFYFIEGGGYGEGTLHRIVAQRQPTVQPTSQPVTPLGPTPIVPGEDRHVFEETGNTVGGIFLDYWLDNGGLPQQGFPISEPMYERSDLDGKTYTVQYFERAVMEYHPENVEPYNVLLSHLGTFRYSRKYPNGAPGQRPNMSDGSVGFAETGKRLGGIFKAYWEKNGGLAQHGYPISDEFTERSPLNGETYIMQYFERAVFEWHPENEAPFDVLLSQLGTFRYKHRYDER